MFLVKVSKGRIADVCLAMKKRGFGAGRWNGAGGKVKDGETIEDALIRETTEEIGVIPEKFHKVAELHFTFAHNPDWDQIVLAYFCTKWQGEPTESEEMAPRWYKADSLPFDQMWPDDIHWIPKVLDGKLIKKAKFTFGEKDAIIDQAIEEVSAL
jgi:8-oxo-dGTP diphosphatase / 2-hydroxy-dATP diphosphatase